MHHLTLRNCPDGLPLFRIAGDVEFHFRFIRSNPVIVVPATTKKNTKCYENQTLRSPKIGYKSGRLVDLAIKEAYIWCFVGHSFWARCSNRTYQCSRPADALTCYQHGFGSFPGPRRAPDSVQLLMNLGWREIYSNCNSIYPERRLRSGHYNVYLVFELCNSVPVSLLSSKIVNVGDLRSWGLLQSGWYISRLSSRRGRKQG
jgi:hypothetical protein